MSDQPESTRIGLLSFAHLHGASYAKILSARADIELLAADPDGAGATAGEPRGRALADQTGIAYTDSYAAVMDWDPDGVIICAETARHLDLVALAAGGGVSILCEKPLSTNTADAQAILDLCEAGGSSLMTAYPVRFHPDFQAASATIKSGALGRALSASGTNNGQAPIASRPWFVDPDLAGGGALIDHTVHLADLLEELLDSSPSEVYAQTNRIIHGNTVEVETGGLLVVTYDDGTIATIDCSWSAPSTYPTWGGLTLTVECEHGLVHFDAFSNRLDHYDDHAGRLRWVDYGVDLDALMLDAWITGLRTGTPVQPDGPTGYRTLALVEAAYQSSEMSTPIKLTTDSTHSRQAR